MVGGRVGSGLASVFHLVLCAGSEVLSLEGQRLTAVFHAGLSDILSRCGGQKLAELSETFYGFADKKNSFRA